MFKPEKAKTVLENWKMLNNEKEGSTKWSIKLKEVKIVQHCIQLTIAKNENISEENISKTAVTFLVLDSMFVNSYCTT